MQPDQFGASDVTVSVSDGSSASQDTFRIIVLNVNDAPVVTITHPDASNNNFVEDSYINLVASAADIDGDTLTYSIDWGDGQTSTGNVQNGVINILKSYSSAGNYRITLTVSDGTSTASDTVTIGVDKKPVKTPRKKIHINSIRFENEEIMAGEDLIVYVTFENKGHYDIKDSRATVFVPELALRQRTGHIDLETNDGITKKFILETPRDAEPGFYDVMIVIYDNGLKRIRYRPVEIVG